ncbi:hypothetical protein [uncultured Nostoc sp.]|uniref:hypothetical protein n=1 Tax=uncultured Nostoc sp. TaxID=340711 RepID=UPI0035C94EF3
MEQLKYAQIFFTKVSSFENIPQKVKNRYIQSLITIDTTDFTLASYKKHHILTLKEPKEEVDINLSR